MASGRTNWFMSILHRLTPWLFQKCDEGNYHWKWEQLCYCRRNEYGGDPPWHGGILNLKTREELVPLRLAVNPYTEESDFFPYTSLTKLQVVGDGFDNGSRV